MSPKRGARRREARGRTSGPAIGRSEPPAPAARFVEWRRGNRADRANLARTDPLLSPLLRVEGRGESAVPISRSVSTSGSRRTICHVREREHPEYHDATRLAARRRLRRLRDLRCRFVVSPRLDPRSRGPVSRGSRVLAWSVAMQQLFRGVAYATDKHPRGSWERPHRAGRSWFMTVPA